MSEQPTPYDEERAELITEWGHTQEREAELDLLIEGYLRGVAETDAKITYAHSKGFVDGVESGRGIERAKVEVLVALVSEQAEDDGLWFMAQYAGEGYRQQELRRLHAAIEAAYQEGSHD